MRILIFTFIALVSFSCSTQDDVVTYCEGETEFGVLYKNDNTFHCPFTLYIRAADKGWKEIENGVTILAYDVDDYFPLRRMNSPAMYRVNMNVLKKDFNEEQYIVSLWAVNKNYKKCGDAREFIFYKITENADLVEYSLYNEGKGKFLFFSEREMPSDDWYHVLKVCDGRETGFLLMGEIKG